MIVDKLLNFFAVVPSGCTKGFLGLTQWYYYLPASDFGQKGTDGSTVSGTQCDITHFTLLGGSSQLPLVLIAVVDDLLRIAGLVALGFVIVASVKFMTSEGNPDNATNARNTLINALAGLAITVTATVFVSFLGNQLGS